jgi:TPR repeat protein
MQINRILVGACLALAFAPAWAGLNEAISAYDAEDYATAFALFTALADEGDAGAEYYLGRMYVAGLGTARDDAKALQLLDDSARQGHVEAQLLLGAAYYFGDIVARDHVRSYVWAHLAAEQGNRSARELRDIIARSLGAAQLHEAQRTSSEWATYR